MADLRIKEKEVKDNYFCVGVSYCDLQYLLRYFERIGYTAGAYGWKSDIYLVDNTENWIISTGYGPVQNIRIADDVKRKIIKKFNNKAMQYNNKIKSYEAQQKAAKKDLLKFLKEIKAQREV